MMVDQLLGRFSWYRRHRGGFWTRIPGTGGGYFRKPSARDERPDWEVVISSVYNAYSPQWLERVVDRVRRRLRSASPQRPFGQQRRP